MRWTIFTEKIQDSPKGKGKEKKTVELFLFFFFRFSDLLRLPQTSTSFTTVLEHRATLYRITYRPVVSLTESLLYRT